MATNDEVRALVYECDFGFVENDGRREIGFADQTDLKTGPRCRLASAAAAASVLAALGVLACTNPNGVTSPYKVKVDTGSCEPPTSDSGNCRERNVELTECRSAERARLE